MEKLPPPDRAGGRTLASVLARRRSALALRRRRLGRGELGQLCWAAQGVTRKADGLRAAPSAGALYPLELVAALPDGVVRYDPVRHALHEVAAGDVRGRVHRAALRQEVVRQATALFLFAADPARTARKYGDDDARLYVLLEAGHAAQNLLLQAEALGLGAVAVGGFHPGAVAQAFRLPEHEEPVYLVAVGGKPR